MSKVALITGINGQDGSYLAELLLEKGYEVHGILKRNSVAENQTSRIKVYDEIKDNLTYADMTDLASLNRVVGKVQPDEIYNLAAQSHVRISFDQPIYTANTVGIGTLNLLEAALATCKHAKIYQASSSEMFGNSIDKDRFQRESTPMMLKSLELDDGFLCCPFGLFVNHFTFPLKPMYSTIRSTTCLIEYSVGLDMITGSVPSYFWISKSTMLATSFE